jgi:hypothetical protein
LEHWHGGFDPIVSRDFPSLRRSALVRSVDILIEGIGDYAVIQLLMSCEDIVELNFGRRY